jgi:hypothetical protein
MDPVLRGELPDRLLAFEDIQDNLGFEGGAVVLSHSSIILLISPLSTVSPAEMFEGGLGIFGRSGCRG